MASSNRERLRAASKKNLQEQNQGELQPTLVSDMVEQLNNPVEDIKDIEDTKDIKEPVALTPKPMDNQTKELDKEKCTEIAQNTENKYDGKEVAITLLLSEEAADFLVYKAIELNISIKQYFRELMINEIETGCPVEDDLLKSFRKVRHNNVSKAIYVTENLKDNIKKTAIKYHLKYTPFMAYVIEKARYLDSNKPAI